MAEVFAIAGSLATVLQLVSSCSWFAKELYLLAQGASMVRGNVELSAIRVQSFYATTGTARASLQRYLEDNADSLWVRHLGKHRVLEALAQESELVNRRVKAAKARVLSMRSKSSLWMSIQWMMQRSSIMNVYSDMEYIKSSMNLLATIAILQTMQAASKKECRTSGKRTAKLQDEM
jgi:hypothetical protein